MKVPPYLCHACRKTVDGGDMDDFETVRNGAIQALVRENFRERPGDNPWHELWCGECHEQFERILAKSDPSYSPEVFQDVKRERSRRR